MFLIKTSFRKESTLMRPQYPLYFCFSFSTVIEVILWSFTNLQNIFKGKIFWNIYFYNILLIKIFLKNWFVVSIVYSYLQMYKYIYGLNLISE